MYKKEVFALYFGIIFWVFLPVIGFFETDINRILEPVLDFNNGSQIVEVISTNTGLVIMTILFIRNSVKQSKEEYDRLLFSEQKLQELNMELANKVKERTKQLEAVMEDRKNTLVNLVHETKTPLTLLNSYISEYIKKHGETEELRIIKASADKLTKDIVNLFDLQRFEKGLNFYDHSQVTNLSLLLKENLELFRPYAIRKNIQFRDEIEKNIFIKADPDAINRIINNIIENAIKYSSPSSEGLKGEIKVTLKVCDQKVHFYVKDHGIGIPVELQGKIFDPYYQINTRKSNFQGIGLGLAIVKEIVNGLSGKLIIESNPMILPGTEVRIVLELYQVQSNDSMAEFNNNKLYYLNEELDFSEDIFNEDKSTILVVEDNITFLNYIANKFKENFNVFVATNGQNAIEKLRSLPQIDLIISDIMMDKMDGTDFLKMVSKDKKLSHVPFLFVTAKNDRKERLENLALGAIDYIEKPFDVEELQNKVTSVLLTLNKQKFALVDQAFKLINKPGPDLINAFDKNCTDFKLTEREIEVVKLLSEGKIYKEIADILNISIDTVKKHVRNIFEKVGVSNKVELINKLEGKIN